jgi:hypothetical protein
MSLVDDLSKEVGSILITQWEPRDGAVVPEAEDLPRQVILQCALTVRFYMPTWRHSAIFHRLARVYHYFKAWQNSGVWVGLKT